jgi:hypothetical protein
MRSSRSKVGRCIPSSGEEFGIEWWCYVVIVDHEQESSSFQE